MLRLNANISGAGVTFVTSRLDFLGQKSQKSQKYWGQLCPTRVGDWEESVLNSLCLQSNFATSPSPTAPFPILPSV